MKWYRHETFCKECDKVVSSRESAHENEDKKETAWYLKYHMDMVHGTDKDRAYYKRFDRMD